MRDIFNAGQVTIQIDEFGKRIWVCVEGETVLRCARITDLTIDDRRRVWDEAIADQEQEPDGQAS